MRAALVPKPEFIPVTIEITFDTQKEIDHFSNMCQWTPLVNLAQKGDIKLSKIQSLLKPHKTLTSWGDFLDLTKETIRD